MNPLIMRVLGTQGAELEVSRPRPTPPAVREDVPVPVGAAPSKPTFRDRLRQRRLRNAKTATLRRALGEAESAEDSDSLIPKDAQTVDDFSMPGQRPQRPVRDVVLEPRDPYGEKEQLMTPASALVAPDCTPEALRPLPPSGAGNPSGRFRAQDAARDAGPATSGSALDVVLDRAQPPLQQTPDVPVTMEAAYRMLGVSAPGAQSDGSALAGGSVAGSQLLAEGRPMPDHKASDGRAICDVFRRFMS